MDSEATVEESVTARTLTVSARDDYDIVAYFATFTYCSGDMLLNVRQRLLISIFLDYTKQSFLYETNSSGASNVYLMDLEALRPALGESIPNGQDLLPATVAVKVRTVRNTQNWRPLKSLGIELRVLTDCKVRDHPNVVVFLGNSWEYGDAEHKVILPVTIFEAETLGNLNTHHGKHPNLTLGL
jgi:hypothetical protein